MEERIQMAAEPSSTTELQVVVYVMDEQRDPGGATREAVMAKVVARVPKALLETGVLGVRLYPHRAEGQIEVDVYELVGEMPESAPVLS